MQLKKIKIIPVTLLLLSMLSGCWDQNIYERIGFILSIGFDIGSSEDKTIMTVGFPIVSESGSGFGNEQNGTGPKVDVQSVETNLIREAREQLRLSSTQQLEGGKIQNIIISNELAKSRKISEYLELYERDTQSTVQASVVIVDGSAKELIEKGARFEGKPRFAIYLAEILRRNSKSGYCPDTNIIKYNIINMKPGISPIVPLLKLENNEVRVQGSALIDRDKMTGQLDTRETACLYLAEGVQKSSEITFDLPEGTDSLKNIGIIFTKKVKSKQTISFEDNMPVVHYEIKLKATLDEYTWGNITNQNFESAMENSVNLSLNETLDRVANKLKAAECDAFGIGDKIRAYHHDYWTNVGELDGWKKVYPKIKITFSVETDIIRYGEIR